MSDNNVIPDNNGKIQDNNKKIPWGRGCPITLTVFVGPVKNPNKFNIFTLVKFDSDNFDLPLTLTIFSRSLLNFDFGLTFAVYVYTLFSYKQEKFL